ncbi:MAG: hypothetical protein RLZZ281_1152 [Pseudomonadota bacterium]|jgi:hypothetical protein
MNPPDKGSRTILKTMAVVGILALIVAIVIR